MAKFISLNTDLPGSKSKEVAKERERYVTHALGRESLSPCYIAKGEGALVTDVDGNTFIDFTENLITRGDIRCVRMGCECTGFGPLVLRAGTNRDWSSVGLSVQWKALRIDFAYLLHYALPDSYIVSLSYQETDSLTRTLSRAVRWLGSIFRSAF